MPNRINDWKGALAYINPVARNRGAEIKVVNNVDGYYDIFVYWDDGEFESYAMNCFEDEVEDCIHGAWERIQVKDEMNKREKRDRLIKETCVLLSKDLYDYFSEDGWGGACEHIVNLAEQFEKELDWQEDDMRDYLEELKKFEDKVLKKG